MLSAAIVIVLAVTTQNLRHRQRQAVLAVRDGQRQVNQGNFAEAVESFTRGSSLAQGLPFQEQLKRDLQQQLEAARRLQLVQQTHELAEQVRRLPGMDSVPAARLNSLSGKCRELWNRRAVLMQGDSGPLDAQLESDVKDIAIFAAMLSARTAEGASAEQAGLIDAIYLIDEAEATFGASAVLEYERRRCRVALGLPAQDVQRPGVAALSAWEHCALGRARLEAGDLRGAAEELAAARAIEPGGLWANYYYGLCAYRLGKYEEAVTALSVCIGAEPDFADCFYNRGLAYAALGRQQDAIQDYRRALTLEPDHPAKAAINSLADTMR